MSIQMTNSREYLDSQRSPDGWEKRTPLEKKLILAIIFVGLTCFILIITVAVVASNKHKSTETAKKEIKPKTYSLCSTKTCNDTAELFLSSMDTYTDPCNNFYQYACGRWMTHHEITEAETQISHFSEVAGKLLTKKIDLLSAASSSNRSETMILATEVYNRCLNITYPGVDSLRKLLKDKIRGWPILQQSYTDNYDLKIEDALETLQEYGLNILLGFNSEVDWRNSSRYAIMIDQPSTKSFDLSWDFIKNISLNEEETKAYKKYITDSIKLVNGSQLNETKLATDIDEMIDFESKLANIIIAPEMRKDYFKLTSTTYKITELNAMFTNLTLGEIVKKAYENHGISLTDEDIIYIPGLDYLKNFDELIGSNDDSVIGNYIGWKIVDYLGGSSIDGFFQLEQEFNKVRLGISESPPRNGTCARFVENIFKYALTGEYVKNNEIDKEPLEEMLKNIIATFTEIVKGLKWMDTQTKEAALSKAKNVDTFVGYPEWVVNNTEVDKVYTDVTQLISNGKTHFDDYLHSWKAMNAYQMRKLRHEHYRGRWNDLRGYSPLAVNAFYQPDANSINILAGILVPPFYIAGVPMAVNYGSIGMVLGHELTHGFDDTGIQFDAFGNLKEHFNTSSDNQYKNKTACFIKQYSSIRDQQTGLNLIGINTVGENIADNGGIREAFMAYKKWVKVNGPESRLSKMEDFSQEQLFFISHAVSWCSRFRDKILALLIKSNTHSPPQYRVNVPESNFDEFAKAFNCKKGLKMNPVKKCQIW